MNYKTKSRLIVAWSGSKEQELNMKWYEESYVENKMF